MKILKILAVILTFAIISIVLYFVLKVCGIANISALKELITKSGKWAPIVYTTILITALVCFCFVPLLNTALSLLGIALFGAKIAFLTNIIAIFFSTSILFFIGDKLGEKFVVKLIGKEALSITQNKIDHKSKFWLPIIFMAPGVPDEAVCLVAGMTKMKYWYLLLVSLCYHALELGLFCFLGSDLIPWTQFTIFEWIIVINLILIDLYLLIRFEKYIDKKLNENSNKSLEKQQDLANFK